MPALDRSKEAYMPRYAVWNKKGPVIKSTDDLKQTELHEPGTEDFCWSHPESGVPSFGQYLSIPTTKGSPGGSVVKNPLANAGHMGSISWVGKIPWRRKWQPTPQYSCLENSRDRGAWWAPVHGIIKCWTWRSNWVHTTKIRTGMTKVKHIQGN